MIGRPLARAGRPGLIGAAARTAVVAGTATAVSNRVAARQQERAARQQQGEALSEAAAPVGGSGGALDDQGLSQLERLGQLHAQGILSDEEFAAAKQRILGT